MTRANSNSGTTILVILILLFTFPIWIGIIGGLFGLVVGLFGAAIGVVAALFGAIITVFATIVSGVFGAWWPDSHIGLNVLLAICLVLAIVMLTKARKQT